MPMQVEVRGNLKIRFQQNDKHERTLWYFSAIDKKSCNSLEINSNHCTALTF